jgi:hypothetical protein
LESTVYTMVNGYPAVLSAAGVPKAATPFGIIAMADLSGYTINATVAAGTAGGSVIISTSGVDGDNCFIYTGGTTAPTAASVGSIGTLGGTGSTCT